MSFRCNYHHDGFPVREPWTIPVGATTNKYLRDWSPPDGAPTSMPAAATGTTSDSEQTPKPAKRKRGRGSGSASASASASGAGGAGAGAHRTVESEDEEDIPLGSELLGMHFAFIGKTETPRAELKEVSSCKVACLVGCQLYVPTPCCWPRTACRRARRDLLRCYRGWNHNTPDLSSCWPPQASSCKAGDVCVCVCVCMCVLCCVCVAGGSDPPRGTTQAISIGIPVVSDKFVLDCANREGLGLKLRQRTHLRDSE